MNNYLVSLFLLIAVCLYTANATGTCGQGNSCPTNTNSLCYIMHGGSCDDLCSDAVSDERCANIPNGWKFDGVEYCKPGSDCGPLHRYCECVPGDPVPPYGGSPCVNPYVMNAGTKTSQCQAACASIAHIKAWGPNCYIQSGNQFNYGCQCSSEYLPPPVCSGVYYDFDGKTPSQSECALLCCGKNGYAAASNWGCHDANYQYGCQCQQGSCNTGYPACTNGDLIIDSAAQPPISCPWLCSTECSLMFTSHEGQCLKGQWDAFPCFQSGDADLRCDCGTWIAGTMNDAKKRAKRTKKQEL